MSTKIDVIFNGYSATSKLNVDQLRRIPSSILNNFSRSTATGTCTLVRSNGINILFDTLGPWQAQQLKDILEANYKLHPDNIDYVICSHSHADHIGNLNLFTNAKLHFVGSCAYREEEYFEGLLEPIGKYSIDISNGGKEPKIFEATNYQDFYIEDNPNLRVTPTPGHTLECVSLIVDNVDQLGKVALVGDLFEREDDLSDDEIWIAAGAKHIDSQMANRKIILGLADYVVPGHGPMFKTIALAK